MGVVINGVAINRVVINAVVINGVVINVVVINGVVINERFITCSRWMFNQHRTGVIILQYTKRETEDQVGAPAGVSVSQ